MKPVKTVVILFLLALTAGCASQQERTDASSAQAAAEIWLNHLDNGNSEELWSLTSELAKARYQKEDRVKAWIGTREVMGEVIRRKEPVNWAMEPWTANLPEGNYRHLIYESNFDNQKDVLEEMILVSEDGEWRVVNWYLGRWRW